MHEELSDFYYYKALEWAKNNNLTKAVQYIAIVLGLNIKSEEARKLAGLCYYKLGNYTMAEHCFQDTMYYNEKIKDSITCKRKEMEQIKQLAAGQQYKKAIRSLEKSSDKSVLQWNYLGCLYGILQNKQKAAACFLEALGEDSGNEEAIIYLRGVQKIKTKRWWIPWQSMNN